MSGDDEADAEMNFNETLGLGDFVVGDRDDPLANVDGTTNALVVQASPIGQVAIIGPGAGPQLAGQGAFSDLIAVARSRPSH